MDRSQEIVSIQGAFARSCDRSCVYRLELDFFTLGYRQAWVIISDYLEIGLLGEENSEALKLEVWKLGSLKLEVEIN